MWRANVGGWRADWGLPVGRKGLGWRTKPIAGWDGEWTLEAEDGSEREGLSLARSISQGRWWSAAAGVDGVEQEGLEGQGVG